MSASRFHLGLPFNVFQRAALLLTLYAFCHPGFAQVQPFDPVVEATLIHDDNLGRAAEAGDVRGDTAARLAVTAGDARMIARDWLLSYGGSAQVQHWFEYDHFDRAELRAQLALRYRFGLGHRAPNLTASLAGGPSFGAAPGSDGLAGQAGLQFSHRLSDEWRYGFSATAERADTDNSFYAVTARGVGAELDYLPFQEWKFSLSLRQRRGDVLSFARPPAPWRTNSAYLASVPVVPAPDFFNEPLYAYTLEADTGAVTVSAAWAFAPKTSLALSFDYADTRRDGLRYLNRTISLGLARRF